MPSASPGTVEAPAAREVVDFPLRPGSERRDFSYYVKKTGWIALLVILGLAILLPFVKLFLTVFDGPWMVLLIPVGMLLSMLAFGFHWQRRIQELCSRIMLENPDAGLEYLLRHFTAAGLWPDPQPHFGIPRLLALVARRDGPGQIYRIYLEPPLPVTPIPTNFEIRVIKESEPNFAELAHDNPPWTPSGDPGRSMTHYDPPGAFSTLKRGFRVGGFRLLLFLFVPLLLLQAIFAAWMGEFRWIILSPFAGALIGVTVGAAFNAAAGTTWHVVPGGLLITRRRAIGRFPRLTYCTRGEFSLALLQADKDRWMVFLCGPSENHTTFVTDLEARVIARAWICPYPPPPLDLIRNLI